MTRLFFSLPASKGFLLAGERPCSRSACTARPTEDLDFFTAPDCGHVPAARDALDAGARERGWATERIHDSDTFCRLVIRSNTAEVVTDLAVDTPADFPASVTAAGPTLAPEELAGRIGAASSLSEIAIIICSRILRGRSCPTTLVSPREGFALLRRSDYQDQNRGCEDHDCDSRHPGTSRICWMPSSVVRRSPSSSGGRPVRGDRPCPSSRRCRPARCARRCISAR